MTTAEGSDKYSSAEKGGDDMASSSDAAKDNGRRRRACGDRDARTRSGPSGEAADGTGLVPAAAAAGNSGDCWWWRCTVAMSTSGVVGWGRRAGRCQRGEGE